MRFGSSRWGGWADRPKSWLGWTTTKTRLGGTCWHSQERNDTQIGPRIGFIWHESQSSCPRARPTPSTELVAENLKLYLLAFFPAVEADMALGRRLGPSPPRAPMTGLLYNLAPSRHFLLLRSGVSGRTKERNRCRGRDM